MKYLRRLPALLGMEYVYVLSDLKFRWHRPHVWKVGITGQSAAQRRDSVQASIRERTGQPVRIRVLLALPIWGAKHVESAAHRAFDKVGSNVFTGTSGGTEWFAWRNWICAAFLFMFGYSQNQPVENCFGYSLLLWAIWLPFDAMLCVSLLWLIEMCIIMASVWGVISFLILCARLFFNIKC